MVKPLPARSAPSIEVGKSADLVVLNNDLFDISAYEIAKTKVVLTMVEGRAVYQDISLLAPRL